MAIDKSMLRGGYKRMKEGADAEELAEELLRNQVALNVEKSIQDCMEYHRLEQEKTIMYADDSSASSMGDILKNVGFGTDMDDIMELQRIMKEDADLELFDIEERNKKEAEELSSYETADEIPSEEYDVDEMIAEADAEAEIEKQAEEKEEQAKEKEEQKDADIKDVFAKIEENTKKLPKNDFIAPKVNESKTPQIIMGILAFIVCIYLGLCASTYYHVSYIVPMSQVVPDTGEFGSFTSSPAEKIKEPTALQCLVQALSTGITIPDVTHISMKIFFQVAGILLGVCVLVVVYCITKKSSEKQMRVGEEHGNKHLATRNDIKKYQTQFMEKDNYNQIYSKNTGLSLNNKKTNRSANVLVIGGTGTGKTFKYINPNILQENATQIITDPSGDLFNKFAPFLLDKGYNVFLFNVNDFNISSYYNPLLNVFDAFGNISEVKVDVLVDLYMKNAKAGKEAGGGDPFWDKAEKAFLTAVIYYVLENDDIPKEDKCFHTVLEKVQRAKADNQNGKSAGETMLTKEINSWKAKVARQNKKIKTPIYYDTFLIAPEKTANTILITTAVDLQIFATEEVDRVTRYKHDYEDTNMYINFDDMAQTQSYLFLGIPQSHQAYNFLISMLYSQMYARLYELGERVLQGKYCLGYRPEIPQFNMFDTKEEMVDFVNHIGKKTEDPEHPSYQYPDKYQYIVEKNYINSTKMYYLAYKGKIYKRSVNRDVLVKLIEDLPQMVYKCNNNYPELPIHVNFLLDEFKNIGEIPNFLTILSTSRKYRIGSHVILQDIAQAQTIYKDKEYETLLANVDTTIFLGSILQADKEEIQKMLGKTTIKVRSQSTGSGSQPNYSYTPTEVDLVSISQLEGINQNGHDDCVVMVRDCPPVIDRKAYLTEHPKYEDYKNATKSLEFDLTRFYNNAAGIYSE